MFGRVGGVLYILFVPLNLSSCFVHIVSRVSKVSIRCNVTIITSSAFFSCFHNTPTITDMYEIKRPSIAKITEFERHQSNEAINTGESKEASKDIIHNPTLFRNDIHMPHSAIFSFSKHGFDIGITAKGNFVVVRINPFKLDNFSRADRST
jgi:hypothetical protein